MNKVTDVWLFVEQRNGTLMNISLELLGKGLDLAKNLKSELAAILIPLSLNDPVRYRYGNFGGATFERYLSPL